MKKSVGYVEDRLVTPYVVFTYLPTGLKYVDFPFANMPSIFPSNSPKSPSIADYQQKRYYSDECPMKWEDFRKMAKGHYCEKKKS